MSKKVELIDLGYEKHECNSKREGDWIVFSCKECEYERRYNWKTREVKVTGENIMVLHKGMHAPTGLNPQLMNVN